MRGLGKGKGRERLKVAAISFKDVHSCAGELADATAVPCFCLRSRERTFLFRRRSHHLMKIAHAAKGDISF